MPVWGMWDDSILWFTSSVRSRKVRNLTADPRCVVSTEDASDPVVIEGTARIVTDAASIRRVLDMMNEKYGTGIEESFLDPAVNATISVRPQTVIGMRHGDFPGSPTRWVFARQARRACPKSRRSKGGRPWGTRLTTGTGA